MNKYIRLIIVFSVFWINTQAQQNREESKSFSLKEAVSYGIKNNYSLKNNALEITAAEKKVKEVLSSGLPQINAGANLTSNIQVPTMVIDGFGPVRMGYPYAATGSISASQLLFDGGFFMGVKAAKEYVNLSKLNVDRNEIETEINISKAYYLALLEQTNVQLQDTNVSALEKQKDELEKLYLNGLAEKTDYDRLRLQYSVRKLEKDKAVDRYSISLMVLKLQMGMNVNDSIILTDKLLDMYEHTTVPVVETKVDYTKRVEYQALDQQIRLQDFDKKRHTFGYIPTLSASFSHQQNAFAKNLKNIPNQWYPGTALVFNLNVPIFDGLRKSALIQQSKINIAKYNNDKKSLENLIEQEVYKAKLSFERANEQTKIHQENLELAQEIFDRVTIKYNNGMGSSLELTNAQNDLAIARQNFLATIFEYFSAQLELRKALGDIKH